MNSSVPDLGALPVSDLAGRTALVTGSSRGIGLGIARALAGAGATVVVHGRDPERLSAAVDALNDDGHDVHTAVGPLHHPDGADDVRRQVLALVGIPDIVVANAGGSSVPPGPLDQIDPEAWETEISANLTSTFLTLRAFVPGMKERGRGAVITLSSTATRIANPQSPPAYTAAKAAVEMLTKSLAVEAGPYGVRANCLAPATVMTETNARRIPSQVQAQIAEGYPLRRLGTVEDVGAAVVFLASDAAGWITGAVLDVAGGSSTT